MMTTWTFKMLPLWLFACVLLGGCVTGPSAEQLANADYGEPISEQEARAKAERWVRSILKDPESARFQWDRFGQGWVSNGLLNGGGYTYGYLLLGRVNARNSFGGYTGDRNYKFIFRDGEIVGAWGERPYSNGGLTTYHMMRLR